MSQTIGKIRLAGGKVVSLEADKAVAFGKLEGLDGEWPLVLNRDKETNVVTLAFDFAPAAVGNCALCASTNDVWPNKLGTHVCKGCREKLETKTEIEEG